MTDLLEFQLLPWGLLLSLALRWVGEDLGSQLVDWGLKKRAPT